MRLVRHLTSRPRGFHPWQLDGQRVRTSFLSVLAPRAGPLSVVRVRCPLSVAKTLLSWQPRPTARARQQTKGDGPPEPARCRSGPGTTDCEHRPNRAGAMPATDNGPMAKEDRKLKTEVRNPKNGARSRVGGAAGGWWRPECTGVRSGSLAPYDLRAVGSERVEMALWPSEKRQFPPLFAPSLMAFSGFFL
jgi:hypothetical protein